MTNTLFTNLHFYDYYYGFVGLGADLLKANLLPSLVELSSDENMMVRSAALIATVLMLRFLTEGLCKQIPT